MLTVKAGKDLIDFISLCYHSNCPPLLEESARQIGIECIVRDLSLMEPVDLVGLPTQVDGRTVYLPPKFLPTESKGLLVFEELNRTEKYMRGPCLQLLTARSLNDYKLPEGWLPVAAINPADADHEVSELDPALMSRFTLAKVVPDHSQWLDWARRSDVHPSVIRYVEDDPTVFESRDSNPRAWHKISKLLQGADRCGASRDTLRVCILNTVGQKRGAAFMSLLSKADRPLKPEDVFKSYDRHRPTFTRWISDGKLDYVRATLHNVLIELQPETSYKAIRSNSKQWANLGNFLADLPGDLRVQGEQFFVGRNFDVPNRGKKQRKAA